MPSQGRAQSPSVSQGTSVWSSGVCLSPGRWLAPGQLQGCSTVTLLATHLLLAGIWHMAAHLLPPPPGKSRCTFPPSGCCGCPGSKSAWAVPATRWSLSGRSPLLGEQPAIEEQAGSCGDRWVSAEREAPGCSQSVQGERIQSLEPAESPFGWKTPWSWSPASRTTPIQAHSAASRPGDTALIVLTVCTSGAGGSPALPPTVSREPVQAESGGLPQAALLLILGTQLRPCAHPPAVPPVSHFRPSGPSCPRGNSLAEASRPSDVGFSCRK